MKIDPAFSLMSFAMNSIGPRMICALALMLAMMARPALGEEVSVYGPFQTLLDRHLTEEATPCGGLLSWFDYSSALTAQDTADLLRQQDALLAEFDPETLDTRERAVAFWVNAYNYFMLQHLLTHLEDGAIVGSVRDYGHLFNPYRVFGLERFSVGGTEYSLRQVELDILLGDDFSERGWKDARVHFAVNCASVGCPPLRKTIYQADTLNAVLSENTRLALDTSLNLIRDGDTLRLTQLFEWYEDDFIEHSGSVREFILNYGSESARNAAESTDRIRYIDYDWKLNTVENFTDLLLIQC